MAQVSNKTKDTTLQLTGSFGALTKFLFGKSSTTKKDIFFSGKAKVVKDGGTASKIKPLKQGNDMLDMLMKIYTFLNRNLEEDKLNREIQNNFKEEQLNEDERRHKELLAAIEKLMKGGDVKSETAEKVDDGPGIFGSMLDKLLGLLEDRIYNKLLDKFAKFSLLADALGPGVTGPLLGVYAALLAPWMLAAYERHEIEKDKYNPKYDNNPYAMVLRGEAKTQGAAGAQNVRKVTERTFGGGGYIPTPEEAKNVLENGTEGDIKAAGGREKLQQIAATPKEEKPKTVPTPLEPNAATGGMRGVKRRTASDVASTPATNKVNEVIKENNTAKVDALISKTPSKTKNTVNASVGKTEKPMAPRIKIPPVRNQEPTFQSMIIYSTRVV